MLFAEQDESVQGQELAAENRRRRWGSPGLTPNTCALPTRRAPCL